MSIKMLEKFFWRNLRNVGKIELYKENFFRKPFLENLSNFLMILLDLKNFKTQLPHC